MIDKVENPAENKRKRGLVEARMYSSTVNWENGY